MFEHSAAMTSRNVSFAGLAAALCFAAAALPAHAADSDFRLTACLERARLDPPAARASAEKWLTEEQGGDAAALCVAMAAFHDGAFADAADRLEKLAVLQSQGQAPGRDAAAARLYAQAGWARLRAGTADAADRLYSLALEKTPQDADLWIDRAIARAEAERFWDALADLDRAAALAPARPEPHVYRASAHKALGQPRAALLDLERALELRPDDPQAVLLRGNVKAESGDLAGAEADWTLTVRLDKEDRGFGRAASANLARLRAQGVPPKAAGAVPNNPSTEKSKP